MTVVLAGLEGIQAAVGSHLGYSGWLELDQQRVELFAGATGDPDPLAHGFLVLALSNHFLPQIVEVQGVSMGVNYGTGRVSFPASVKAGDRLRAGAELVSAEPVAGGVQTTMRITVEVAGQAQAACVVDALSRYLA